MIFRSHAVDDDFAVGVFVLGNARKFATDVVKFYHGVDKALGIYDLVCKQVYCRIEFPIAVLTAVTLSCFPARRRGSVAGCSESNCSR